MSEYRINQITNQAGTAGPQVAGITTFSSSSGLVMPSGATEYRGGRGRGVFAGGYHPAPLNSQNIIDYITISTAGNALDFGDLSSATATNGGSGGASSTRGIFYGHSSSIKIDYITISSTGNAQDFGNPFNTSSFIFNAAFSNNIRFIAGGGTSINNATEYITIASLGNASFFGDLATTRSETSAAASPTRGVFGGGRNPSPSLWINSMEYVTITSTGNSLDFGDLTGVRRLTSASSNSIRGIFGGGDTPGSVVTNIIDYITIASLGDALDFGDLTVARALGAGVSSSIRAIFRGGRNASNTDTNIIDYITIASTGNATDFGDATTVATRHSWCCSDAHGGLGD